MNLQVRTKYLNALGVPQWYARKRLLGAAESPVLDWPDASELPVQTQVNESVVSKLPVVASINPVVESVGALSGDRAESSDLKGNAGRVNDSETEETRLPAAVALEDSGLKSLHWRSYRFGDWLFIDEAESGQEVQGFEVPRLLENVVYACRGSVAAFDGQQSFDWPVFQRKEVALIAGVSGEALLARWFDSRLADSPAIVLVQSAHAEVIEALVASSEMGARPPVLYFPHSLSELVAQPALKRNYWHFLVQSGLVSQK